jgi:hypothetical protein
MFLSMLCWATVIRSAAHLGFQLGVLSYLAANANVPVSQLVSHKVPGYASSQATSNETPNGNGNTQKADTGDRIATNMTGPGATQPPDIHTAAANATARVESDSQLSEDVLAIERKHEYCIQLVHRLIYNFR